MIETTTSEAAYWTDSYYSGQDTKFYGISLDSRSVNQGSLFVALKGAYHDGHDYLQQAQIAGASAALVSRPVETTLPLLIAEDTLTCLQKLAASWRLRFKLPLIGVLGSNGKTTVKEMIAIILQQQERDSVLITQGNQNNLIGVPLTLCHLNSNHRVAVIELGASEPGEIAKLATITKPDIAVITNAGLDHQAGFGSIAGAALANAEVFSGMTDNGIAILNGDDECLALWQNQLGAKAHLRFGFGSRVDVRGIWEPSTSGGLLTIKSDWGNLKANLNFMGRHNAANAIAAASACLVLGIEPQHIAEGLAAARPVNGRLSSQFCAKGARIIDDTYNANPSSLQAALATLADLPGVKILVLGNMAELGDKAQSWHDWAGKAARAAGIDFLFGLGDLAALAVESFGTDGHYFFDYMDLIKELLPKLNSEVTVLVKGSRCMKMEKLVTEIHT